MRKLRPREVPEVSEPGSGPAGPEGRGLSLTFMLLSLFFPSPYREPVKAHAQEQYLEPSNVGAT